ncbi:MAG: zf-HC2 domain-containing protein [Lachnospiraceae bacterium]|nr:zf-HC2 domain-containing protein [Lachnospiraceae bacterium]
MKEKIKKPGRGCIDCVQAERMIRLYLEDRLSAAERERFIEHVARCESCRGELEIDLAIYQALSEDGKPEHKCSYDFEKLAIEHLEQSRQQVRSQRRSRKLERATLTLAVLALVVIGAVWAGIRFFGEHETVRRYAQPFFPHMYEKTGEAVTEGETPQQETEAVTEGESLQQETEAVTEGLTEPDRSDEKNEERTEETEEPKERLKEQKAKEQSASDTEGKQHE